MTTPASFAIDLRALTVEVPERSILSDVTWQVPRGAKAAILGPNGSGKSTLLRAITAYGHHTSGEACVLGETLGEMEVHALRRRMGIVDPTLMRRLDRGVRTDELVATGFYGHLTTFFDRPTGEQLRVAASTLSEVGLGGREKQRVETLSSGELTRAWLARALVHAPELLVLDEPCMALDLLGRETLLATLHAIAARRPQLTMLNVTHHLEDLLPDTDHVLLLGHGRMIASGVPDEVLTAHRLEEAFSCPLSVRREQGRWRWSVSPHVWKGFVS